MSLELFIIGRHTCEKCGQQHETPELRLGSGGMGSMSPRDQVLAELDCDALECSDCLALLDDQAEVEVAHRKRRAEYQPEDERQEFPHYHAPELRLIEA